MSICQTEAAQARAKWQSADDMSQLLRNPVICSEVLREVDNGLLRVLNWPNHQQLREYIKKSEYIMREIPSADIDFYQENGYIRYTDFFSNDEVQSLADAIDHAIISERERILGANNGGRGSDRYERVFNQMVNMWYDYPQVKSFAFNHQLAETARKLSLGNHVRIYHDHALVKPAGVSSLETNWH